ncbi:MAG: hypothetical protein U1A78_19755 [Polyangia bacterium]
MRVRFNLSRSMALSLALSLSGFLSAAAARADVVPPSCGGSDPAVQACTGKQAADACTFSNGTRGSCAALRCTTDGGATALACVATGANTGGGCNALPAAGASAAGLSALASLFALTAAAAATGVRRLRRSRRGRLSGPPLGQADGAVRPLP